MRDPDAAARAGFLLALLLFAFAWPLARSPVEPCENPVLTGPGEVRCAPGTEDVPRLAGPARRVFERPIDPNRADAVTLETLPGIGPARARAILETRSREPFRSLHDLMRVPGLGPRRVAALEPYVAFDGPLAPPERASVESPGCRRARGGARSSLESDSMTPCGEEP